MSSNLGEMFEEVYGWYLECPSTLQSKFRNSDNLIEYHTTLGRQIRNEFNLWEQNWEPELENGFDVSKNHPDAISMSIIELVQNRARTEHENKKVNDD